MLPKQAMNVFGLISKAKKLGVDVLQIADNLPLDRYAKSDLIAIRNYAENTGIHIEVGAKEMTRENLGKYIELAVFFGSPILRFVIDGDHFKPELNEVNKIIQWATPLLEKNNLALTIENHDRFTADEFAEVVVKARTDKVGICLDSVNSMGAGEGLKTVIKKLGPLAVNLHVKEFNIRRLSHKMGFIIEGCPLGEGMLPVEALLQQVSSRCSSAILEQWTPPEVTIEGTIKKEARWAQISIDYLKNKVK